MLIMGTVIFREKSWLRSLSENYGGGGGAFHTEGRGIWSGKYTETGHIIIQLRVLFISHNLQARCNSPFLNRVRQLLYNSINLHTFQMVNVIL